MAEVVNLDALIPREDFLAVQGIDAAGAAGKSEATRTDLTKGESFHLTLRKPDFQRETAAWSPEAVRDFIEAFIDGDLIPSVICWQSPARLSFVIDGAHRLSVIIAWLLDDYGDADESSKFYDNKIPEEQRRVAKKTRDLVNKSIGPWRDFKAESEKPGSNPKLTDRARALAHSKIPLLWIRGQDSVKAERAFLTINRAAVRIDPTELKILNARFQPNAIAARAIVRNATGHKYWKDFSPAGIAEVESLGAETYKLLYSPPLNPQIRTDELPIAGFGYGAQTLPLIFDLVNIAAGLPVVDATKKKDELPPITHKEPSEPETLKVLRATSKLGRRLTGMHASSLGLYPAVYFYAVNGRHQPTAVLAMAALVTDLERDNRFDDFTRARARFENFLVEHKMFVNQITSKFGSMGKGYRQLRDYYRLVLDLILDGKDTDSVLAGLREHERFQILVKEKPLTSRQAKEFSQDLKQMAFLKEALARAFVCGICGARIDTKAMQLDHTEDKSKGGLAVADNSRWTHPYCNSTFKRLISANEEKLA